MAKEKMVTRTVTRTLYEVMYVNTSTREVGTMSIQHIGEFLPYDKAIKQIELEGNDGSIKFVQIVSHVTENVLVGLSEKLFYELGEVLPDRNTTSSN